MSDARALTAKAFVTTDAGNELLVRAKVPQHMFVIDGFGIEGTECRSDQVLSSSGSSHEVRASGETGTTNSMLD